MFEEEDKTDTTGIAAEAKKPVMWRVIAQSQCTMVLEAKCLHNMQEFNAD
jgi:hypothetical protein